MSDKPKKTVMVQQAAGQLSAVPDYTRELTSINKNLEIL